jgi:hypothetical protein
MPMEFERGSRSARSIDKMYWLRDGGGADEVYQLEFYESQNQQVNPKYVKIDVPKPLCT